VDPPQCQVDAATIGQNRESSSHNTAGAVEHLPPLGRPDTTTRVLRCAAAPGRSAKWITSALMEMQASGLT